MIGVYEKLFNPPKKQGVTCTMVSAKQVYEEKLINDADDDKEEHNSKILRQNALPMGDKINILMDTYNEEKWLQ